MGLSALIFLNVTDISEKHAHNLIVCASILIKKMYSLFVSQFTFLPFHWTDTDIFSECLS